VKTLAARALLALVWLLHWLPLSLQAALGRGLGRLLHRLGRRRREIAHTNLALCLPELAPEARAALVREHFEWLGRSVLERGLVWYASPARLRRLIHVEGDIGYAERSPRPVMWLVPHFVGLDVAAASVQLFQSRPACSVYMPQRNPAFDAAFRRGRTRLAPSQIFSRQEGVINIVRAIKRGAGFFNLPDMDFGPRDAAFVPFFGTPARMAKSLGMVVQPLVCELLPGGQGYRVRFLEPWTDWPTGDAEADTAAMNRYIEAQIRRLPAQYLWVHKRFKTRPPGQPTLYGPAGAAPSDSGFDDD
jgi:KDO2-lipid IV(A) lauroyltransferase